MLYVYVLMKWDLTHLLSDLTQSNQGSACKKGKIVRMSLIWFREEMLRDVGQWGWGVCVNEHLRYIFGIDLDLHIQSIICSDIDVEAKGIENKKSKEKRSNFGI